MPTAFISLGSNLGDRRANLLAALDRLRAHPQIAALRISRFIETAPVGKTDQPDFINAAAQFETTLSPHDLLAALLKIEADLGRVRTERWGPRVIDLDLLLYDDRVIHDAHLQLPHPLMHERRFVLEPLTEIAPHARHPLQGKTVAEMLAALGAA